MIPIAEAQGGPNDGWVIVVCVIAIILKGMWDDAHEPPED